MQADTSKEKGVIANVYQSLIEVNARTTDCVLKTLYPQPLVKSSELFMNKKHKYKSIS